MDTSPSCQETLPRRWCHLRKVLERSGPFCHPDFEPSSEILNFIMSSCKILVIGAGGLGCELLKNLGLMGFKEIHVIDMDTIDLSNLNRQFLFRRKDIGSPKAEVAAKFINERIPGCNVTPHYSKIQDFDEDFYRQFHIIVCGLDSIVGRRWINGMLLSLLSYDENGDVDQSTVIPIIDGGTEGFKGNARVILPGMTACVDCTLDLFPPQMRFGSGIHHQWYIFRAHLKSSLKSRFQQCLEDVPLMMDSRSEMHLIINNQVVYPLCTIASTPRLPEHCIEYVKLILWPKENPFDTAIDGDDPVHINWIYEKASERANQFNITGMNYRLVQGVVKNIIPAVASTNAVIAASCTTEVFKIATSCCMPLNNYMVFNDVDGIYTYTYEQEKKSDCLACSQVAKTLEIASGQMKLQQLIDHLSENPAYQMKNPGITSNIKGKNRTLYLPTVASIEEKTRENLKKSLVELGLENGSEIMVADITNPNTMVFILKMLDGKENMVVD